MRNSEITGLETSGMSDSLQRTGDGLNATTGSGYSHHKFLGASAAQRTSPATSITSDNQEKPHDGEEKVDEEEAKQLEPSTVVRTVGELEVFSNGNRGTTVRVSSYLEGVGLELVNEFGQMSVLLLPEDVDQLCEQLIQAKTKTVENEVKNTRAWITEDYRNSERDE